MPITKKDVSRAAELARLGLTEEESEVYTGQLQRILGYVEKLSQADTSGIEPAVRLADGGAMRRDCAAASIPRDEALKNAPDSERGCFKVPKIIE